MHDEDHEERQTKGREGKAGGEREGQYEDEGRTKRGAPMARTVTKKARLARHGATVTLWSATRTTNMTVTTGPRSWWGNVAMCGYPWPTTD